MVEEVAVVDVVNAVVVVATANVVDESRWAR